MRKPSTSDPAHAKTREALIHAAGEVFAELGYRAATVRDICKKADANVAAVNYHFRDKAGLYRAVWQYSHHCALQKYPLQYGASEKAKPQDKLRAYIGSFLLRIFDKGELAWFGKLISREMIEPTPALESLVKEEIQPQLFYLSGIVRSILGPKATDIQIQRTAMSVVSQCVFYHHCQPVIRLLLPHLTFSREHIDGIAEHIYKFSIAAMKELRK
jgi:AcrR family transcriptional regulator